MVNGEQIWHESELRLRSVAAQSGGETAFGADGNSLEIANFVEKLRPRHDRGPLERPFGQSNHRGIPPMAALEQHAPFEIA